MADEVVLINHLPQIADALHHAMGDTSRQTAQAIISDYEEHAPRKSGFMASSGYVVTHNSSTYGAHTEGSGPMLPALPPAEDDQTAYAAVAAAYAAYPEYGTRFAASQPAFHPALDSAVKIMLALLDGLETAIASKVKE